MSSEKATLQEAWRLGYTNSDAGGLLIPCASPQEATRVRFALYAATKQFRNGKGEPDQTLADALENCAITLEGAAVRIQRKLASRASQAILAALDGKVKSVEEHRMVESLERVMGKLEQPGSPTPAPELSPTAAIAKGYGARTRS